MVSQVFEIYCNVDDRQFKMKELNALRHSFFSHTGSMC